VRRATREAEGRHVDDYFEGVTHTPRDPDFERRVRESFARQAAMQTLGITLARVSPGEVVLELPFRDDLTQQHGFLHAGVVTSAMDSACGYSALTLMEPGAAVLSVEFKVNLLAPARGRQFRAIGRVVRAGRTITVTSGELWAFEADDVAESDVNTGSSGALVAVLTGTMMAVRNRAGLVD
jgi:uncharacterized protein (TIGR00369 family)